MSIEDVAKGTDAEAITAVESWPGLAMLARPDGSVVAASAAWDAIGVPATGLRINGFPHYIIDADSEATDADSEATDAEVEAMSGEGGRAAIAFRNTYQGEDGMRHLLEWHASPFGTAGATLATARVIRSYDPSRPDDDDVSTAERQEAIEDIVRERRNAQWREQFAATTEPVFRWVASLEGEVLFSEGGGQPPGKYAGMSMGDFGKRAREDFGEAMARFQADPALGHTTKFSEGERDNPEFDGRRFLSVYNLLRSPSGRPYAVAVVSIEFGSDKPIPASCSPGSASCPLIPE